MSNSGTKARTQRRVPRAARPQRGMKGCSTEQTPGKEGQGSRQAETAAGETPVAGGSHYKANIKAISLNTFIIPPRGFLNEQLQQFCMCRTTCRRNFSHKTLNWIQLLFLLNFGAFKKKGQTKKTVHNIISTAVHL